MNALALAGAGASDNMIGLTRKRRKYESMA